MPGCILLLSALCGAGVLVSRPAARDIKIDGFSLGICGNELIKDCSIELTIGRRYGLIGQNGCGKTSFLQSIASRWEPLAPGTTTAALLTEAATSSCGTPSSGG